MCALSLLTLHCSVHVLQPKHGSPYVHKANAHMHSLKQKIEFPNQIPHWPPYPLQRLIFDALAKISLAISSVVTMTSDSQKSRRGRFYGSSGLHLHDQSSVALVKPKAFNFSSKILLSVSNETLQCVFLQNQFEPSVCVHVCVCAHARVSMDKIFPPWKCFTSNQ